MQSAQNQKSGSKSRNRTKLNKSKNGGSGIENPPPQALSYVGPIQSAAEKNETSCISVCITNSADFTSNGLGIIDLVVQDNPAGSPDWSSWSSIYDEYRVLGWEVSFIPNNQYSKVSTVCQPLLGVIDRADGAPLGAYTVAVQYGSVKNLSLENPWRIVTKLAGSTEEAQFSRTGAPSTKTYIKFYSTGLTTSSTYGLYVVRRRVQFRARAI
jgi:hypothetical protein